MNLNFGDTYGAQLQGGNTVRAGILNRTLRFSPAKSTFIVVLDEYCLLTLSVWKLMLLHYSFRSRSALATILMTMHKST